MGKTPSQCWTAAQLRTAKHPTKVQQLPLEAMLMYTSKVARSLATQQTLQVVRSISQPAPTLEHMKFQAQRRSPTTLQETQKVKAAQVLRFTWTQQTRTQLSCSEQPKFLATRAQAHTMAPLLLVTKLPHHKLVKFRSMAKLKSPATLTRTMKLATC